MDIVIVTEDALVNNKHIRIYDSRVNLQTTIVSTFEYVEIFILPSSPSIRNYLDQSQMQSYTQTPQEWRMINWRHINNLRQYTLATYTLLIQSMRYRLIYKDQPIVSIATKKKNIWESWFSSRGVTHNSSRFYQYLKLERFENHHGCLLFLFSHRKTWLFFGYLEKWGWLGVRVANT